MACAIWEEKKRSLQDLGSDSGKSPRFRRLLQFPHRASGTADLTQRGLFQFQDSAMRCGRQVDGPPGTA